MNIWNTYACRSCLFSVTNFQRFLGAHVAVWESAFNIISNFTILSVYFRSLHDCWQQPCTESFSRIRLCSKWIPETISARIFKQTMPREMPTCIAIGWARWRLWVLCALSTCDFISKFINRNECDFFVLSTDVFLLSLQCPQLGDDCVCAICLHSTDCDCCC